MNMDNLTLAELIELRNDCEHRIYAKSSPHSEADKKTSTVATGLNSLFNETYYLNKIAKGDYSDGQLMTIRGTARRQGWKALLQVLDGKDDSEVSNEAVDGSSFWEMMEKMAGEL